MKTTIYNPHVQTFELIMKFIHGMSVNESNDQIAVRCVHTQSTFFSQCDKFAESLSPVLSVYLVAQCYF